MSKPPELPAEVKKQADYVAQIVLLALLAWVVPFLLDILVDYSGRLLGQPDLVRERAVELSTRTVGLLIAGLALLRLYEFFRSGKQRFLSAFGALVLAAALGGYLYLGYLMEAVHLMVLAGAGTAAAAAIFLLSGVEWLFAPPQDPPT